MTQDTFSGTNPQKPNPQEKRVLWIKVQPDYEPVFALLKGLHRDSENRYWMEPLGAQADIGDIERNMGQSEPGVSTFSQMSNNVLTSAQEYIK
jgi:hypothetical protein